MFASLRYVSNDTVERISQMNPEKRSIPGCETFSIRHDDCATLLFKRKIRSRHARVFNAAQNGDVSCGKYRLISQKISELAEKSRLLRCSTGVA